jgi:predicted nucleotidyltransferase
MKKYSCQHGKPKRLNEIAVKAAYSVMLELMRALGEYRNVIIEDIPVEVEVDFLAGEYEGTSKSHRTQIIQDVRARKARGCELAFELHDEILIEGFLPDGGKDSVTVHVAGIVPFIVMKGMAMHDRIKEKDAWDIYYCLKNHRKGIDALVEDFKPLLSNSLVVEGLKKIAGKFASIENFGPVSVAAFEELTDPDEKAFRQRDAYERMHLLLSKLGISAE